MVSPEYMSAYGLSLDIYLVSRYIFALSLSLGSSERNSALFFWRSIRNVTRSKDFFIWSFKFVGSIGISCFEYPISRRVE